MNDDLMDNDVFGMLRFLGGTEIDTKLMIAFFIVFIIIAYKALGVLKNTVIVSVISACFPFILDRVLGFDIDITFELILSYVILGVVLYLLYEVFRVFHKSSQVFVGVIGILMFPFVLVLRFLGWMLGFGDGEKREKKKKKKRKKKKKSSEEEE